MVVDIIGPGGTVALDAATLAALEEIQVAGVASEVTLAAVLAQLQLVLAELGGKLEAGQPVALAAGTLNALATDASLQQLLAKAPTLTGDWDYLAGDAGTVNVPAGLRVVGIAAHSAVGGTLTINGGPSIPVPANVGISFQPYGNLVAPTVVLTGTDSYVIETLA